MFDIFPRDAYGVDTTPVDFGAERKKFVVRRRQSVVIRVRHAVQSHALCRVALRDQNAIPLRLCRQEKALFFEHFTVINNPVAAYVVRQRVIRPVQRIRRALLCRHLFANRTETVRPRLFRRHAIERL